MKHIKDTCIRQISAGLKTLKATNSNHHNLDYGGGKYSDGTEYLLKEKGIINVIYDVYNQPEEHNRRVRDSGIRWDSVTLLNVLNVIQEKSKRVEVVRDAWSFVKTGGLLKIRVYTGDRSGVNSTKVHQTNMRFKEYLPEIEEAIGKPVAIKFGEVNVIKC